MSQRITRQQLESYIWRAPHSCVGPSTLATTSSSSSRSSFTNLPNRTGILIHSGEAN